MPWSRDEASAVPTMFLIWSGTRQFTVDSPKGSYLSSVQLLVHQRPHLLVPNGCHVVRSFGLSQEDSPHLLPSVWPQIAEPQRDVDAADHGRVETVHTVRGEDHDSFVVFEGPQEDGYEGIASVHPRRALLQKDVGLVE